MKLLSQIEVGQLPPECVRKDAAPDGILDIAHVTANDYVMDLGSGDGRTVITAAKRGARATGIEVES
jgi:cyclopropane fatty-acyl-phospholipid synthase-like methyltransferase